MTRHTRFVWILTVALGLALACGPTTYGLSPSPVGSTSSSPTGSTSSSTESSSVPTSIATGEPAPTEIPLTPNPLNVQVTLDTANAQTGVYPAELIVQTNGNQYVLLLPEIMMSQEADGTLVPAYGTPVTLTPVSTIEGYPFSQGFLAAVQLAPHGLFMIEPAMLSLTIPGEYAPGDLVGFGWDGSGDNFHLYPAEIISGGGQTIALFNILHIGDDAFGVGPATPQEIADQHARVPEGQTAQDEDLLSPLTPLKFVDLERQNTRFVTTDLMGLPGANCNDVDVASQKFITWYDHVQAAQGLDYFKKSIDSNLNTLRSFMDACLQATCSICMGTPPIKKQSADSFLIHAFYAERLANFAGDDIERKKWYDLANMCANNAGIKFPHPIVAYCGGPSVPGCGTAAAPPAVCPNP